MHTDTEKVLDVQLYKIKSHNFRKDNLNKENIMNKKI